MAQRSNAQLKELKWQKFAPKFFVERKKSSKMDDQIIL